MRSTGHTFSIVTNRGPDMRQVKLTTAAAFMIGAAFAAAFPLARAAGATPRPAELARYEKYAGAPVRSLTHFHTDRVQNLAPARLAVWLHPHRGLYLLTVETPCTRLPLANAIGLTSSHHMTYAGSGFVTFRSAARVRVQRCRILKIVPVDVVKMRRDNAAAPAASRS